MANNETKRVSLCLTDTKVSSLVDDFLTDAKQVSEDDLLKLVSYVRSLGTQKAVVKPVESPSSKQTSAGSPLNPGAGIPPQQPKKGTTP